MRLVGDTGLASAQSSRDRSPSQGLDTGWFMTAQGRLPLWLVAWHPKLGFHGEVSRQNQEKVLSRGQGQIGARGWLYLGIRPLDGLDGAEVLLQAGDQLPLLSHCGHGLGNVDLQLRTAPYSQRKT